MTNKELIAFAKNYKISNDFGIINTDITTQEKKALKKLLKLHTSPMVTICNLSFIFTTICLGFISYVAYTNTFSGIKWILSILLLICIPYYIFSYFGKTLIRKEKGWAFSIYNQRGTHKLFLSNNKYVGYPINGSIENRNVRILLFSLTQNFNEKLKDKPKVVVTKKYSKLTDL